MARLPQKDEMLSEAAFFGVIRSGCVIIEIHPLRKISFFRYIM